MIRENGGWNFLFEGLMVEIFGNKMFVIDSAVGQTNHSDKNAVIFFHGFPW